MRTRGKSQSSMGHAHQKTFSGPSQGKTLKKCKNNGKTDNIVIDIDDDDDNSNRVPIPIIICSDEEDEISDKNKSATASEASSSSKSPPFRNQNGNTTDGEGDECQFLHEIESPVKISKGKRTYCAKARSTNRYGLDLDFDGDLSDKDQFDGDYVEDKSGEIQAEWERANKRKKKVEVENENKTGKSSKEQVHLKPDKDHLKGNSTSDFADADKSKKSPFANSGLRRNPSRATVFSSANKVSIGVDIGNNKASNVFKQPSSQHPVGNVDPNGSSHVPDEIRNPLSNLSGKENFVFKQTLIQNSKSRGKTRVVEQNNDLHVDSEILKNIAMRDEAKIEPNGSTQLEGKDGPLLDCLFYNREKHKETDEYKRAEEERLASAQQALRVQAEEAENMRQVLRRKNAENLRLLDMERRQKQRVEEIRETQKKDEENMNMKEKLRAEVRLELKQLELKCLDMGSLLRGLGVHVGGGIRPQPHEIRVAYKKALLSFHPDRAPASDIRKLVEAEEKFKLISRMKEKLMPTS